MAPRGENASIVIVGFLLLGFDVVLKEEEEEEEDEDDDGDE